MSRRTRRPLVLSGIETLEQRQMLHGGVASEPKTALLHLVDNGRDADRLATARQHHAAQLARAAEARAQAHQRHMLVHEQSLHVKATAATVRDHAAAAHAAVLRVTAAHPAKHVPAKHHKPHAKAKHHAQPITTTPVAATLGWGSLIGSVVTTATTGSSGTRISSPAITTNSIAAVVTAPPVSVASITPVTPATVTTTAATRTLAVGEVLDTKIIPGGIAGPGVTYTITPQPLPANMLFDRTTGELTFTPAPGQGGHYQFTVTTNSGLGKASTVVPIDVTAVPLAVATVSGQVVDELGLPLAGMPVALGNATATTDLLGRFTLTGVPANPGPINAGGAVADLQSRQGLLAPVDQNARSRSVRQRPQRHRPVADPAQDQLVSGIHFQRQGRGDFADHHKPGHPGLLIPDRAGRFGTRLDAGKPQGGTTGTGGVGAASSRRGRRWSHSVSGSGHRSVQACPAQLAQLQPLPAWHDTAIVHAKLL